MRISNRVKRNISLTLAIIAVLCISSYLIEMVMEKQYKSSHIWFKLFAMSVYSFCSFDNFIIYQRRLKRGILFGNERTLQ